jgi:hypothetical protein
VSPRGRSRLAGFVTLAALLACAPAEGNEGSTNRVNARSTIVIGLDVSGSFRQSGHFDDAIEFAANYIYAHMKGYGGLRVPTNVFVGTLGGVRQGEAKVFHPIQDLTGKSVEEIARDLRDWFPETDPITDFNAFFERVAVHVKRQNLVLAPLNIVMFSDGVPDYPTRRRMPQESLYVKIDLTPLEYLSRSVTVRLLYAEPTVAQQWERRVERKRVRLWTQESDVMLGWRRHALPGQPAETQDSLWSWMSQIVDFRVRRGRVI